jgi:glucose-6-phosphate 1-dehydrogenase
VFVLFGVTGDLSARKIAPALYNLHKDGFLDERMAVVGVGRRDWSQEQFRGEMLAALKAHSRSQPVEEADWQRLSERWHYQVVGANRAEDYSALADFLRGIAAKIGPECGLAIYLATPPDLWPQTADQLGRAGLAQPLTERGFARIVVEKPFGKDLESARVLNSALRAHWQESQIFRIDHYLGKETVQNILVLRLANSILEPLLNHRHVESVQITTAETVGMEGRRGAYYEEIGALRDMIQNHMLQVLAMLTMEAPASLDAEAVRDEKARLLQAIRPLTPEEVRRWTFRGQYQGQGGTPGYRQEKGVAADSQMETFAAVRLRIQNERWSGVPFYLRTGKRLEERSAYISVQFKGGERRLFSEEGCDLAGPNRLVIQLQPREGAFVTVNAKVPGDRMLLRPVRMAFEYGAAFGSAGPEAYERLLLDAMGGEAALFLRDDEVEAAWRVVDAIRTVWDNGEGPELLPYAAGTWGPPQAEGIFGDRYQRWHNLELR